MAFHKGGVRQGASWAPHSRCGPGRASSSEKYCIVTRVGILSPSIAGIRLVNSLKNITQLLIYRSAHSHRQKSPVITSVLFVSNFEYSLRDKKGYDIAKKFLIEIRGLPLLFIIAYSHMIRFTDVHLSRNIKLKRLELREHLYN